MNFKYISSAWAKATVGSILMDAEARSQLQHRVLARQVAYNLLMLAGNGNPEGIEARRANAAEWAFVVRDESSVQGTWRMQTFGVCGYKTAQYFDSLQEAVEAMVVLFPTPDKGALERAMAGESWGAKTASVDLKGLLGGPASMTSRMKKMLTRTHRKAGSTAEVVLA